MGNEQNSRAMRSRKNGQSILEAVVGGLILIPVVLLAVDATFLSTANRSNVELAKNTARASGNQADQDQAATVAQKMVAAFQTSSLIKSAHLVDFRFDEKNKQVAVTTTVDVTLPVPVPGFADIKLTASAAEPIVALPASK